MSRQERTAIIVSQELSQWGSCRVITPNLQKAYERLASPSRQIQFFSWTARHSAAETLTVARQVLAWRPTRLVFLDHTPHPRPLLQALFALEKAEQLPPVDFHIYGDFTLYAPDWQKSENLLKRMRAHFYCASHRQEALVASFLKQKNTITSVCPFPVDTDQYFFSPALRQETRRQLGLAADENMLLYTGRLSMQKNILRLTRELIRWMEKNPRTKFFLCGHFDKMGAPFFGVWLRSDSQYYDQWRALIEKLPAALQERVIYLGNKSAKELLAFYNAADLYVSLSTHHDEDFGMSPLEALSSGCPCLLSDWGGYASFALDEMSCRLSPVVITGKGLQMSSRDFQEKLGTFLSVRESDEARQKRATFYSDKFSIEHVSEKILQWQKNHAPRFQGFTPSLNELSRKMRRHLQGAPLFETGPKEKTFYSRIYKNYVQGLPSKRS
jgi:glycosyltransferase involved in cell wall biosynthesis